MLESWEIRLSWHVIARIAVVAMNNAGAVSRCPECWIEDRVTMIETSQKEGFVSCPHHGEITIRHFVSRMTEAEKELAGRSQQNQHGICNEGRP